MPRATRARAAAAAALLMVLGALSAAPATTAGAQAATGAGTARAVETPSIGIDTWDPDAVLGAWRSIIADSPPMGFTGDLASCRAGSTSAAYKAAELASINALRSLGGVGPLSINSTWSAQAQQTAMLMAVNQRLSHDPKDSKDPPVTWTCLNTESQDGAASSNLFLGFVGVDAMWGYIADWGDTNVDVGHRRWLICPGSTEVGLGDVPAPRSGTWPSNAMKVFDGPPLTDGPSREPYVAWPNAGLVPLNYAGPYLMLDRFSLQVPNEVSTTAATVSIASNTRGSIPVVSVHTDELAYCQPVVEWGPSVSPNYGETWTITVSGLTQANEPLDPYRYAVQFVDLSAATPFVHAAYVDFLGRSPTSDESTSTTRMIDADSGEGTYADARKQLVTELSQSQEWVSHLVTGFYENTLGRPPDATGLTYWTGVLADGRASVASVASYFYASEEYLARVGGTSSAWVDDLYAKLLGRVADPSGHTYWVAQTARIGRGRVAAAFYQSLESREARVTDLYEQLLGREPDTGGLAFWAARLTSVSDLVLAASLATSDEYDARAQVRYPS
jgi:hypothetical protein